MTHWPEITTKASIGRFFLVFSFFPYFKGPLPTIKSFTCTLLIHIVQTKERICKTSHLPCCGKIYINVYKQQQKIPTKNFLKLIEFFYYLINPNKSNCLTKFSIYKYVENLQHFHFT